MKKYEMRRCDRLRVCYVFIVKAIFIDAVD